MAGLLIERPLQQLEPAGAGRAGARQGARGAIGVAPSCDAAGRRLRPNLGPPRSSAAEEGYGVRLRRFLRLRRDTARSDPETYDPLAAFLGVSMGELGRLMLRSDLDQLRPARVRSQHH